MQCPDEVDRWNGMSVDFDKCYGWLIQFRDGNRLDLHVIPVEEVDISEDKLCRILLDKDGILGQIPEPSDEDYRIRKPSQEEFWACCNEFWWCMNNVAKGLWREELPYVLDVTDFHVRPMLKQMLEWKIGCGTDFSVSAGKMGKYMERFLPGDCYARFLDTYGRADTKSQWQAAFIMCDLFQETACEVAEALGFSYNQEEARNSRWFLEHVRTLPKDAAEIIQTEYKTSEKERQI